MLRCIKTELMKCLHFPFVLLMVAGVLTLCLSSVADYIDSRNLNPA